MDHFFLNTTSGAKFVLFGKVHIITLMVVILFNFGSIFALVKLNSPKWNRIFQIGLALLMILLFVLGTGFTIATGKWSLKNSLPLHLCDTVALLGILTLLSENKYLYELIYFWGWSGTPQALLTPAIKSGFPDFMYIYFFAFHGSVIIAILFMTIIKKFRPCKTSLLRAFVTLNLYAGCVFLLNLILKSNYMYLRKKPAEATLLNYLGQWPVYLLSLEAIALISFLICYAPFWIKDRKKAKREKGKP